MCVCVCVCVCITREISDDDYIRSSFFFLNTFLFMYFDNMDLFALSRLLISRVAC